MPIENKDMTEEPRSEKQLREALDVVTKEIVKADFNNPTLYLQLSTIRDALKELLRFRLLIEKLKKEKADDHHRR